MKTIFTFCIIIFITSSAIAQFPNAINYQAVARDESGNLLSNQNVSFRFSILQGSITGTTVYQETLSKITNEFGLVTLAIGSGTVITGMFSSIDWSTGTYYLATEMDPLGGTDYQLMGTSQFLSVPYALFAKTSGSANKINSMIADANADTKVQTEKYANEDVIRFDLGGEERMKILNERLNLSFHSSNTYIGDAAGLFNTTGYMNTGIGFNSLYSNTEGSQNTAFGYHSLAANTSGFENTAFGIMSLNSNTEGIRNSAFGPYSLYSNTTGEMNLAGGSNALFNNTTGSNNVAYGNYTLFNNSTGESNVSIGSEAGYNNIAGSGNVFLGTAAGYDETGSNKLYIDNSSTSNPLIWGDFSSRNLDVNGRLNVNGKLGVGNSAPDASALVDLTSSTGGMLLPRMTTLQRSDIPAPAKGLLVYDSTFNSFWTFNGKQLYEIKSGVITGISDTDADTKIQVEKTPDEDIIRFDLGGTERMVLLENRLDVLSGNNNLFIGNEAGKHIAAGSNNLAIGKNALHNTTTGIDNLAVGNNSLENNLMGANNMAVGTSALSSNTNGNRNTVFGWDAGFHNTTGSANVAVGYKSLYTNDSYDDNTAVGDSALATCKGSRNIALGKAAGGNLVNGSDNVFIGYRSGYNRSTNPEYTYNNTFVGFKTGSQCAVGKYNTFLGSLSGNLNNSSYNTLVGNNCGRESSGGNDNTAVGNNAFFYGSGYNNVAIGSYALFNNSASSNVALGYQAGYSNSTGIKNTFLGFRTGKANTTASQNTFIGSGSGIAMITGSNNTATGAETLAASTNSSNNTANGYVALNSATSGSYNTATGSYALNSDLSGERNTAVGYEALKLNETGNRNTAVGGLALSGNVSGMYNVALGYNSGSAITSDHNTIIGYGAGSLITSGENNIMLGYDAEVTEGTISNAIGIGYAIDVDESNQIRIGNSSNNALYCLAAWNGLVGTSPSVLYVDNTGKIGRNTSSRRYKYDIENMEDVNWIYKLNPVNFKYKTDESKSKQYGLIAEEVEQVNSRMVVYDAQGRPDAVDYISLISPLLKETQGQKKLTEELRAQIEELKAQNEAIKAQNQMLIQWVKNHDAEIVKQELINRK